MDLVSVILPIYNMEKYLRECLDTIINQTYDNFEAICVVDGGNDQSYEIAKEYSEKDSRFIPVWQENAGSGPARNNGIAHAKGKYIIFVDPDDWIQEDFIERLVKEQGNRYDLVLSGCTSVIFENNKIVSKKYTKPVERILEGDFKREYLNLYNEEILGSPTKKLYLKSIIDKYNIQFPDLRRSQDIVFNYRYFDNCCSVKVSSYTGYHYRIEPKDRMLRLKADYYKTVNFIVDDVKSLYLKWTGEIPEESIANTYVHLYIACIEANILGKREYKNVISDLTAREIFERNTLTRCDVKIISVLVLSNKPILLRVLIYLRYYIKRIIKRW